VRGRTSSESHLPYWLIIGKASEGNMGTGLSFFTTLAVWIFAGSVWVAVLQPSDMFKDDAGVTTIATQSKVIDLEENNTDLLEF